MDWPLLLMLGGVVIGRMVNERAYRQLDDQQKLRLMDGFSRTRAYSMIPMLVLIAGFFVCLNYTKIDRQILSITYFALVSCFVVARTVLNHRKLVSLDMPANYRRMFAIAQIIQVSTFAVLVIALAFSFAD